MAQATKKTGILLKRAYDPPSARDGTRVLIDRLWPRGLSKADAAIDHWFREIAPSTELRQWFHHDRARWDEFRRRYEAELSRNAALVNELRAIARQGPLTLIYSARDEVHNQAVVLRDALKRTRQISPSKKGANKHRRAGTTRARQSNRRARTK